MVIWPTLALLQAAEILNRDNYRRAARQGLSWLQGHILPDGRMETAYETSQIEDWRPVSSETAMALKCFACAYHLLGEESLAANVHALGGYLLKLQDAESGAIYNQEASTVGASLQDDLTLTDLVYTDGYALLALQEAYLATNDDRYLVGATHLADFLVRTQCRDESPRWDGGWRGSLDARSGTPRGRANQNNPIDEGGMYSVYTGWCASTITYGLVRQAELTQGNG
jgi:uncharacterized protein YyaL (SSP411 family)